MKLSTPDEMDEIDEEWTENRTEYDTVVMFGEEMQLDEAVALVSEVIQRPDDFGFTSEERVVESEQRVLELEDRVAQLEEMNEHLRDDVAALWKYVAEQSPATGQYAVPKGDGTGWLPSSIDSYDPTAEFE